jgi:DNA-binding phage protein
MTDTETSPNSSFHDRLLAHRIKDPEFRAEFERRSREIKAIDAIVNELDSLRTIRGMTKADLAREIGKNPASVRRLFTAPANPELRTVVAMAEALDADVVIVPRLDAASAPDARRRATGDQPDCGARPPETRKPQ